MANLKVLVEAKVIWLFLRPSLFWIVGKLPFVKLGETHYDLSISVKKMPRASAILCRRMLRRLDALNQVRRGVAGVYLQRLKGTNFLSVTGLEPDSSSFLRLPVLCADQGTRDQLLEQLRDQGASPMYGEPLSVIDDPELFAGGPPIQCPNAARISKRLLTLPTHAYVRASDIDFVVSTVLAASAGGSRTHVAG